ncbi:MAG: zinc-dependent metalloprotease [Propionibacteriaceae bacterium]|nr:zinc-dependent metalloprotease [Micropruina sp.]
MASLPAIDWDAARNTGLATLSPGAALTPAEASAEVDALRRAADVAEGHIRETTGLQTAADGGTFVIDRASWLRANLTTYEGLWRAMGATPAESVLDRARATVIGAEMGAMLAAVGGRILGQFDPFGHPQRLLLVAPNVAGAQRHMGVDPWDFKLWVCLHEQTHRFQFGAAPWLRDYLIAQMSVVAGEFGEGFQLSPARSEDGIKRALVERVLTPEQRVAFDAATGAMSLLEGHADVMMDRVGTSVLPTLPRLREALEKRRSDPWQRFLGRLLGMELKMAQYREGAKFVRAVIDTVGLESFNRVFSAAEFLPTRAEIADPSAWVARVHP